MDFVLISAPGLTLHSPCAGGLSVLSSLVLQLEYYMVTGLDVWDLLVGLRSHLTGGLEAVCETLADTFHRQPGPVQQYYYVRHMAIKTSLYRSGGRTAIVGLFELCVHLISNHKLRILLAA